ncbi:HAMP domain-containing histidine kinase [Proteobacteria bacterium 005FR1]|nr:HAMP domain-containing histidine kinase [Proteobacteria bacterium 005FR1]
MQIAVFVENNIQEIIGRWESHVLDRLGRTRNEPELIDYMPILLRDLVGALRSPLGEWQELEGAESHARHRVEAGVDIAEMSLEMSILEETIIELAQEQQAALSDAELRQLVRLMGQAKALAVRCYTRLQEKNRGDELARHLGFVVHQIRNPLSSAALITEILAMVPEGQRESHIVRLRRAINRLSKLLDDFVVDVRLHSGQALSLQSTSAEVLVDKACEDVSPYASEREVSIVKDMEPLDWEVDPELMTSALTNLLSIAIKFSCRGDEIRVEARSSDNHVRLEIEDQCGRLPEDLQERLFQPVQKREHRTGFGLGLSLVKQVVEAHQGTIDMIDGESEGFAFVLDLPCRQGGEQRVAP